MKLESVVFLLVIGIVLSAVFDMYLTQTLDQIVETDKEQKQQLEREISKLNVHADLVAKYISNIEHDKCIGEHLPVKNQTEICNDFKKAYRDELSVDGGEQVP